MHVPFLRANKARWSSLGYDVYDAESRFKHLKLQLDGIAAVETGVAPLLREAIKAYVLAEEKIAIAQGVPDTDADFWRIRSSAKVFMR